MRIKLYKLSILLIFIQFCTSGCTIDEMNKHWAKLFRRKEYTQEKVRNHIHDSELYLQANKRSEALRELEAALKLDPQNVEALNSVGNIHRETGNYLKAAKLYEKACKFGPKEFRPHYNAGLTYYSLAEISKDFETEGKKYIRQAIDKFTHALNLVPNEPGSNCYDVQINLGACHFFISNYAQAEAYFTDANKNNPSDYKAPTNLGILYEKMARDYQDYSYIRKALKKYKQSIELNSNQPNVSVSIADIYIKANKPKRAIGVLSAAIKHAPHSTLVHQRLGACYFKLRKLEKALASFQKSIKYHKENAAAYRGFGLVCMYAYINNKDRTDLYYKAIEAWKLSLRYNPNQKTLIKLLRKFSKKEIQ